MTVNELTPEILKQCGFEDRGLHWQGRVRKYYLRHDFSVCGNSEGYYFMTHLDAGQYNSNKISTLHHLQNLVHALTGTELNIIS